MLWVFIVHINEKGTERQEKHHSKFIYPGLRLEVNKKQQNSYSKEPQLCDTWAWWVTPLILLWDTVGKLPSNLFIYFKWKFFTMD